MKLFLCITLLLITVFYIDSCNLGKEEIIRPIIITEPVSYDSDDPAIWLHPSDLSQSLILGTDKYIDGALFVFDITGKIIQDKSVFNLNRPNNVDVEYGFSLDGEFIDIAVVTERNTGKIRIFALPSMESIDNGGIDVFIGEEERRVMGIALYKRENDGAIFAIVGRKSGPEDGGYLWQYKLEDNGSGGVKATKVREFGLWSGIKEIEAIAVDDENGYVYYSDEMYGIRKYYADPKAVNRNNELAVFGQNDFTQDMEGISIYKFSDLTGYILISDQQNNSFNIYKREGDINFPHKHELIKKVKLSTNNSDGSEIVNAPINTDFQYGLFVAMSDDNTFQYYSWEDIAGKDLLLQK